MSNSWYVEFLIRNRYRIRSSIYKTSTIQVALDEFTETSDEESATFALDSDSRASVAAVDVDLYDDIYNDLLLVEKELQRLYTESRMTESELEITRSFLLGKNIVDVELESGISRITISKIFSNLCDRISFHLGGTFTNEGLLDYFIDKYQLNPEQIARLQNYIVSNRRHT